MPHTQTATNPNSEIDRPRCTECQSAMWLARVSRDGAGKEYRQFECPVCEVSTRQPGEIERATIKF
ncbi:MAG TPA: hypothetical protein VNR39_13435 [Pseudolabrys sp.]|nr:hypothetical protein [Pseudolabrys sp.]